MKVTSKKPKGQRIKKTTRGKQRPFWIEPLRIEGVNWWFCLESGEWKREYKGIGGMCTSYYSMTHNGFNNIYSLKAAKRIIAKWNVPKGTKFSVGLPWVGYSFTVSKP